MEEYSFKVYSFHSPEYRNKFYDMFEKEKKAGKLDYTIARANELEVLLNGFTKGRWFFNRLITYLSKQEKSESAALRQLLSKVFGDYSNIKEVYLVVSVHVCVGVPSYLTFS
jgi:hypothetical protein